mgnify:CR=1 FL=1
MNISIPKGSLTIDPERFSDMFLRTALKNGFDSMKKRDLDVLLFHCLVEHGNLKRRSNNELSLLLQIPESRVASLKREERLRFGNVNNEWVRDETLRLLQRSKLKPDSGSIKFSVEDPLLKDCLNAKLKELGRFGDSSFNSEIMSIDVYAFGELIEALLGDAAEEVRRNVEDEAQRDEVPLWKDMFAIACRSFADGAGRRAGERLVDLGVFFATGGADGVDSLVRGLSNLLNRADEQEQGDEE